jgi:REP element-mobilizing transposase RayT
MHSRVWFLTWRTYGTWLPGDDRGFVGAFHDRHGVRTSQNEPGVPMAEGQPHLMNYAARVMTGGEVRLAPAHAADLLDQFQETCAVRGWKLLAAAVLSTHVHVIVEVDGDPEGFAVLRDLKSYAGRRLNRVAGRPAGGSWWSASGSRRVLKDAANVAAAMRYVSDQPGAYLIWTRNHPAG